MLSILVCVNETTGAELVGLNPPTGAGMDDNMGVILQAGIGKVDDMGEDDTLDICVEEVCEVYEVSMGISVGTCVGICVGIRVSDNIDHNDDCFVEVVEAFSGATTQAPSPPGSIGK